MLGQARKLISSTFGFMALAGAAVMVTSSTPVLAQGGTCNGFVSISYLPGSSSNTQRVRLSFSAGDIDGGAKLTISQVAFYLDCRNKGCTANLQQNCNTNADCVGLGSCLTLGTTCIDDGNIINYASNITSTCSTSWTAGSPNSANQVLFTANPAVMVAANSSGCQLEFDILKVAEQSNDTTPNAVEEVAGYMNASCDNGSRSSASQSGFVSVFKGEDPGRPAPAASFTALLICTLVLLGFGIWRMSSQRAAGSDASGGR